MSRPKNLLTKKGYEKLKAEHDHLSRVERPRVVKGVSDAAAEGDRSENAEYIYGKKKLRELDKRLQYLSSLLRDVQITECEPNPDRVVFGATVAVRDEHDNERTWTIVGEGEADMAHNQISWQSPVAKALMGKSVGDVVEIERPKGVSEFEILAIRQ